MRGNNFTDMEKKVLFNKAAVAGLYFGAISSAYLFANWGITMLPSNVSILGSLLNFVLWILKFAGCIWLMKYLMEKLVSENAGTSNKDTLNFGMLTSVFSAIIYAAVSFAYMAYIGGDTVSATMEELMQTPGMPVDSTSIAMMDKMLASLPQLTFWGNLIYCSLYGIVLSAILSARIPSKDPFSNVK